MRVLALDVGVRRIGVALSDPTGLLASPLTTLERKSDSGAIDGVLRLAAGNDVGEIVVGIPLSLSGQVGLQARLTVEFVDLLSGRADVPVTTVDERFSTVEAQRLLREAGTRTKKDRGRVDAAAAAVILQSYLDGLRMAKR